MIEAAVIKGSSKVDTMFILRIPIIPSNYPFQFKRLQFPISLCFAMAVTKSLEQILLKAGIYFCIDCFTYGDHGQMYVTCARISNSTNFYIVALKMNNI